jgi:hypothetical protein
VVFGIGKRGKFKVARSTALSLREFLVVRKSRRLATLGGRMEREVGEYCGRSETLVEAVEFGYYRASEADCRDPHPVSMVDTFALRTQVCSILQPLMVGGFFLSNFRRCTRRQRASWEKKTRSLDAEGSHAPSHVPTAVRLTANRKVGRQKRSGAWIQGSA